MKKEEEWLLKEKYHGERTRDFLSDCERLRDGEPLAYLIGHIPFLGTTIHLDSRPLIPRPETEYWVEDILKSAIAHRRGQTPPMRVLDLCAGSGCIGVAVLRALPDIRMDFVEIDTHHHPTIRKNLESNGLTRSCTHIIGGDLFENVHGRYDYILSNPPYIDPLLDRTEPSVRAHEPSRALYGGAGGLDLIFRILERAPAHLSEDGMLVIEHEPEQVSALTAKAEECHLLPTPYRDQYGLFRYTVFSRRNA